MIEFAWRSWDMFE